MAIEITIKDNEGLDLEAMENIIKFQACCAVLAEVAAYAEPHILAVNAQSNAHLPRVKRRENVKRFAKDYSYLKRVANDLSKGVEDINADYFDALLDQTFEVINSVKVAK